MLAAGTTFGPFLHLVPLDPSSLGADFRVGIPGHSRPIPANDFKPELSGCISSGDLGSNESIAIHLFGHFTHLNRESRRAKGAPIFRRLVQPEGLSMTPLKGANL